MLLGDKAENWIDDPRLVLLMSGASERRGNRRTPKLYKEVASILETAQKHEGSLKNLVYQSTYTNKKALLLLACKTLEHKQQIRDALQQIGLIKAGKLPENSYKETLLCVLAYELVFGKKELPGRSGLETIIISKVAELQKILEGTKLSTTKSLIKDPFVVVPRYVRVNTLLSSEEEVLGWLQEEGWQQVEYPEDIAYGDYLHLICSLREQEFIHDAHVPNLLVFPAATEFYDHQLYTSTMILLQNKASCLASMVLKPSPGDVVLDGCSAPGMKATHLAAMMENQGTLYCVEKSKDRVDTLQELLELSSASTIAKVKHEDFTLLNPSDYEDVTSILLDPSCSGSGMANRLDELVDGSQDKNPEFRNRLQKLQSFQARMLKHALSFPNVRKVVYSTCSIYEEENEAVIDEVLHEFPDFKLHTPLKDVWSSRGMDTYPFGKKCIRTSPGEDLCNGSFIAEFRRRKKKANDQQNNMGIDDVHEQNDEEQTRPKKKRKKK